MVWALAAALLGSTSKTSGRLRAKLAPVAWEPSVTLTPCGTAFPPRNSIGKPVRKLSAPPLRSEEHTSELQSQSNLVCRLLLEKKKNKECICDVIYLVL